jgi:hypothetical protein
MEGKKFDPNSIIGFVLIFWDITFDYVAKSAYQLILAIR